MKYFLCATAIIGLLFLVGGLAPHEAVGQSTVLRVCAQGCPYQQIQMAIDAALNGDEIAISPGTYRENLSITKSLMLSGVSAAGEVVIESRELGQPTARVLNPNRQPGSLPLQVKLQGLTITGARPITPNDPCAGDKTGLCTGLYIESSSVKVKMRKEAS